MKFDELLAKSCDNISNIPTDAKLFPHLRAVENAGAGIFESVGELILQQIALPTEPWLSRLERGLKAACLCHDIGKANDGFQKMVRRKLSPKLQPARHELLSALLLAGKENQIRKWALNLLSVNGKYDDAEELLNCVIAAVGGHHIKLDEDWHKASIALCDGGCGTDLKMLLTHHDLKKLFGDVVTETFDYSLIEDGENYLGDSRLPFKCESNRWKDKLEKEPEWWRFAAVLKALTTASDVAGSALLPKHIAPKKWVRSMLNESSRVTTEQMNQVVAARLNGKVPRPFQKAVAQSKKRVTLVEAGCGTGKTAAAYMWAATHAGGRKLFFCYPTTGTATEGFRGYVAETDVEAELMHSRAIVDKEEIEIDSVLEVKSDEDEGDHQLRIESLKAWSPQVIICTADTVLALVRNNRRGLYNSPAILTASFVFDELHAYDNRMFAAVVALIKAMPEAHFLLMTASLPKERREFLFKHIEDIEQIPTPKELEKLPRYIFKQPTDEETAFEKAKSALTNNLKVLWICNTVKKAQAVFDELKDVGLSIHTYHSRFKYEHRVKKHRKVIDGFDPEKSSCGMIAITTQVAEMSLDLDADILISEVAPVSALIQRLGRLNRRITPENKGEPRTAYFLPMPEKFLPYDEKQVVQGQQWIEALMSLNRPLTQEDLAERFNAIPNEDEERLDTRTEWLDSGWFARPAHIREASVSVSVILHEDINSCRANPKKELINKEIPMNFDTRRMKDWREYKGRLIAPQDVIDYDEERGARWK